MLSQSPRVLDRDSQAGSQAGPIRHASASKEAAHAQEVAEASVFERAVEHIIDSSTPGHEHEHAVEHTNEHDVVEARPDPNKVSPAAHAQEVAEASVFERAVEHIIDSSTPGHE